MSYRKEITKANAVDLITNSIMRAVEKTISNMEGQGVFIVLSRHETMLKLERSGEVRRLAKRIIYDTLNNSGDVLAESIRLKQGGEL